MILIGIGGNLESPQYGSPRRVLAAALKVLEADGIGVLSRSAWYRTEPVPRSTQPWFVNAVASLATELDAIELLRKLLAVEMRFGRTRGEPDAARILDLDLLDHHGRICETDFLVLPHPRLHLRRFVLQPLAEIVPGWQHPLSGLTAGQLLAGLGAEQPIERLSC